jgi:hypothetical protein
MSIFSKLFKCFDKKERHYISEADLMLQKFDASHPQKSVSQLKEIAKHKNIFYRKSEQPIKW